MIGEMERLDMAKKKMSNNEQAGLIAIIGGIFMLLAGITGAATWAALGDLAEQITGNSSLNIVFQILALVGSLGGLVIILGGLMIHGKYIKMKKDKRVKFGKFFMTIGAGMGVIGLIIFLVLAIFSDDPAGNIFGAVGLGLIGLILTIIARQKAK